MKSHARLRSIHTLERRLLTTTATILFVIFVVWSEHGINHEINASSIISLHHGSWLSFLPTVSSNDSPFTPPASKEHFHTRIENSSSSSSNQSSIIVIDSGYDFNQTEDVVSDSISFGCSFLSALSAFIVFIMFYMEHSWIFSFENKTKKMIYSKTLKQAIMELGCCQWFPKQQTLYLEISKMERKNIFIQRAKRKFIRRMMLSLLVSDLICSVSRMLFIAWWWICSMGAPGAMFERRLAIVPQGNQTTPNLTHFPMQPCNVNDRVEYDSSVFLKNSLPRIKASLDFGEKFFPFVTIDNTNFTQTNTTILRAYYVMRSAPLTIHKFFVHLIYAFTLSTATWCVIVAFAIFATTRQFKWLEEDFPMMDHNVEHTASFNSNYSEDSRIQFDTSKNSSIHAMALLSSSTAQESQPVTTSQPLSRKRNYLKSSMNAIRKMSRKTFYEICFHVVAWGIAMVTFGMLFFFRIATIHSNVSKNDEIWYITMLYISWAIYFTLVSLSLFDQFIHNFFFYF